MSRAPERNKAKTARCKICCKRIRIPHEWTAGSAARRHYWRHHRHVMLRTKGSKR